MHSPIHPLNSVLTLLLVVLLAASHSHGSTQEALLISNSPARHFGLGLANPISPHSASPQQQSALQASSAQHPNNEFLKISLEPIVASPAPGRFLRVACEIELSSSSHVDAVEKNLPLLQQAALENLSSLEISQLDSPHGRETLRAALKSVFNSILGAGTVGNVFFTEFVLL